MTYKDLLFLIHPDTATAKIDDIGEKIKIVMLFRDKPDTLQQYAVKWGLVPGTKKRTVRKPIQVFEWVPVINAFSVTPYENSKVIHKGEYIDAYIHRVSDKMAFYSLRPDGKVYRCSKKNIFVLRSKTI